MHVWTRVCQLDTVTFYFYCMSKLSFYPLYSSDPDPSYWPKDKEGSWDQILHGCDGCLPSRQCLWRWRACCFRCDRLWWQQLVWYVLSGQAEGADGQKYYVLQAQVQKICVATWRQGMLFSVFMLVKLSGWGLFFKLPCKHCYFH